MRKRNILGIKRKYLSLYPFTFLFLTTRTMEIDNKGIRFKLGVLYIVDSYLWKNGDIENIPALLREVATDYEEELKKRLNK